MSSEALVVKPLIKIFCGYPKEVFVSTFDALMEMWELMAEEYKEEFDEVKVRVIPRAEVVG